MGLIRTPPHVLDTPRSRALSCPGEIPELPPISRTGLPLTHCLGLQLIGGWGGGATLRLSDGGPKPPLQPQRPSCLLK